VKHCNGTVIWKTPDRCLRCKTLQFGIDAKQFGSDLSR
jgi:hypothetical protein